MARGSNLLMALMPLFFSVVAFVLVLLLLLAGTNGALTNLSYLKVRI